MKKRRARGTNAFLWFCLQDEVREDEEVTTPSLLLVDGIEQDDLA